MDSRSETIMWLMCFGGVAACMIIANLKASLTAAHEKIYELEQELEERKSRMQSYGL